MTHPLSIGNTIKDNTTVIVDRLTLEMACKPLMALIADYSENNNKMVFYVTSAPEDNGYNGKPIAPRLLLYHKTLEITKDCPEIQEATCTLYGQTSLTMPPTPNQFKN